jgi:hypothetical protein
MRKGQSPMSGPFNITAGKRVNRLAIRILVCVLSLCLATVVLGCESSDRKEAQKCLQAGADRIQEIRNQASEWQNQMISATGATELKTVKKSAEAVRLSAEGMSKTIDKAREEYKNITGLQGVDDYVKYAELRLAQLDKIQEMLNKTDEYLQKKVAVIDSEDLSGLAGIEEQYSAEISSISDEVQKIDEEAAKMKNDKRL